MPPPSSSRKLPNNVVRSVKTQKMSGFIKVIITLLKMLPHFGQSTGEITIPPGVTFSLDYY